MQPVFGIDGDAKCRVFESVASAGEIAAKLVLSVDSAEDGVAHRRDAAELEEQMEGVGGEISWRESVRG